MGLWTIVLGVIGAIALALLIAGSVFFRRLQRETATPIILVNEGGRTGRALVLVQTGLGSFAARVADNLVDGLAAGGWEVERTTFSRSAPGATEYDLLALVGPVYMGAPARPMTRYIERIADFRSKPVFAVLTGAGDTGAAAKALEEDIVKAKGRALRTLQVWTQRPNDETNRYAGSNRDRAIAMVLDAARSITAPAGRPS